MRNASGSEQQVNELTETVLWNGHEVLNQESLVHYTMGEVRSSQMFRGHENTDSDTLCHFLRDNWHKKPTEYQVDQTAEVVDFRPYGCGKVQCDPKGHDWLFVQLGLQQKGVLTACTR
jgi:hypothetical protein